jgi:hypothetical protein
MTIEALVSKRSAGLALAPLVHGDKERIVRRISVGTTGPCAVVLWVAGLAVLWISELFIAELFRAARLQNGREPE